MRTSAALAAFPIERVAIQGELGSFSHEAALALAPRATVVPCALSAEVFRSLTAGEVDTAVIPIENSLAGSVLEHYDLLLANNVRIEQEHLLRVRHNLIAPPGVSLASLREVYSHPIALDQCRAFFHRSPHLRPTPFYDTAGSVKHVLAAAERGSSGAVASRQAASQYGGVLLVEGIEDNPQNYTRFFLIRSAAGRQETVAQSSVASRSFASQDASRNASEGASRHANKVANKVSLCFAVENRAGSLAAALEVFAAQQISLTRIESRPVPGKPWQYIFYADYQMEQPERADAALAELARRCSLVKELGRYRAAVTS